MLLFGKTSKKDGFVKVNEISETSIFPDILTANSTKFIPNWPLQDNQYFYIDLSKDTQIIQPYLDVLVSSASYNTIVKSQFPSLDGVFTGIQEKYNNEDIFNIKFQRVWGRYYFKKPLLFSIDGECKFYENRDIIVLNNRTDAYWEFKTKRLYFETFSHIKKLFKGIEKFYREARESDINNFKEIPIIQMNIDTVGQRAGQKIAIMLDNNMLKSQNITNLKNYAKKYNQSLKLENNKVIIDNNSDVELLYKLANGLFYTSEVTNEAMESSSSKKVTTGE